ncbi:type I restriction enzyme M protein [Dokdonia sp. Hel_I_63]|uniref:N-6 DNA methylase n=1 Tax=Dokdonia sp. Hel_I_63 TaxID=1249996 RepID=UPI0011994BFB|nr:N-6 DNA methylase [Dokdonia sp. Hel_I_63]TVZ23775.1 type I restriction enzyme M protein [Dokdonia sp. Hel_I_63]
MTNTMQKENIDLYWRLIQEEFKAFGISIESFDAFLYLLALLYFNKTNTHLEKTNLLPNSNGLFGSLAKGLLKLTEDKDDKYIIEETNSVFNDIIERWPAAFIENLDLNFLSSYALKTEYDIEKENFPLFFEILLKRYLETQGRNAGLTILPEEISKFVCDITATSSEQVIYNPFAGLASFGMYSNENSVYVGEELDERIAALANCRLWLRKNKMHKAVYSGDSFDSKLEFKNSVDLFVASPPFKLKERHFEEKLISHSLKLTSDTGKVLLLLPNNFFNSGRKDHKELRKKLINEDLVDKVISFPGGLLPNSGIPFTILLLDKNKEVPKYVAFVKADAFVNTNKRQKTLTYSGLSAAIIEGTNSDSIKRVSISDIKGTQLHPNLYFTKEFKGELLGTVLKSLYPKRINEEENITGKYFRFGSDQKADSSLTIDSSTIESVEIPKSAVELSETCIIITNRGSELKVALFEYAGVPIYVSQLSNCFIANLEYDKDISLEYVSYALLSDTAQEQLKLYSSMSSVFVMNKNDIQKIRIEIPSFKEQLEKLKVLRDTHYNFQLNKREFDKLIAKTKDEALRNYQSLNHSLRQYLNNLKSNAAGTKSFLLKNEGKALDLDIIYSKNLNITFREHLEHMNASIESMNTLLKSLDNEKKQVKVEKMSLDKLVSSALRRFNSLDNFKFTKPYKDESSFVTEKGYFNAEIEMNKDDFFNIFSNIISNANHGFTNSSKEYVIATSIMNDFEKGELILEISNNGDPMPEGFTYNKLITRGEKNSRSSGTGIGGADIKQTLEKHNAYFEIISDPEDAFPVKYSLHFPAVNSATFDKITE